jgi:hypothetical protein
MEWIHTGFLLISILVGIVGIILFFVERKEKIRLKNVIEADAIATHKATGMLLGNAQAALLALQNNDSSGARQSIGQSEGQAQILFENTVKSLWLNRGYDRNDIQRWVRDGVILPDHVRAFSAYLKE